MGGRYSSDLPMPHPSQPNLRIHPHLPGECSWIPYSYPNHPNLTFAFIPLSPFLCPKFDFSKTLTFPTSSRPEF